MTKQNAEEHKDLHVDGSGENPTLSLISSGGPASFEAEQAVLGALLVTDLESMEQIGFLRPDHFYYAPHMALYRALQQIKASDLPPLPDHIQQAMGGDVWAEWGSGEYRGLDYLYRLQTEASQQYVYVEAYAKIVVERWRTRQVRKVMEDAAKRILLDEPSLTIAEHMIEGLMALQVDAFTEEPGRFYGEMLGELYDQMEKWREGEEVWGIPSPWPGLDKFMYGWQKGELTIVACRPGMGKSAFILACAIDAAKKGYKVYLASMEMSRLQITQRAVAQDLGLSTQAQREATDLQWSQFVEYVATVGKLEGWAHNLYIDDGGSFDEDGTITPNVLYRRLLRHKKRYGLDLVVVDYLQLMEADLDRRQRANREAVITSVAQGLKRICMSLDVPFLTAAQLNREAERGRKVKPPKLSNLRESGGIEQAADNVIFIHRPGYYLEADPSHVPTITDAITHFIGAKHRNGPIGTETTRWIKEKTTFENIEKKGDGRWQD